jgi:hypothetical protein
VSKEMPVQAKFKVTSIKLYASPEGTGEVQLSAVYGKAGEANAEWSKYTPSGDIRMSITNPLGFKPFVDAFHANKDFFVIFTEVEE